MKNTKNILLDENILGNINQTNNTQDVDMVIKTLEKQLLEQNRKSVKKTKMLEQMLSKLGDGKYKTKKTKSTKKNKRKDTRGLKSFNRSKLYSPKIKKQKFTPEYIRKHQYLTEKYNHLGLFLMNLYSLIYDNENENENEDEVLQINKKDVLTDPMLEKLFICSTQFEIAEKSRWFNDMLKLLVKNEIYSKNNLKENLFFKDQISSKIYQKLSENCSQNISLFKTMEPHLIILGPKESGKTTTLYQISKILFDVYLNQTLEYLKTFVFVCNFKKIFIFLDFSFSVKDFYCQWLESILSCLCVQRIGLYPFKKFLTSYFLSIFDIKAGPKKEKVPTSFQEKFKSEVLLLKIFCERLHTKYKIFSKRSTSSSRNTDFLKLILTLPNQMAEIFGFDKILNIYDNFEYSFIKLFDNQFNSKQTSNYLSFYIKQVIRDQNYVITGNGKKFIKCLKTSEKLVNVMKTTKNMEDRELVEEEVEVDLLMHSSIFSMINLIDVNEEPDLPKSVTLVNTEIFSNVKQTNMVEIEVFRGCPAYLAHVLRFIKSNKMKDLDTSPMIENEVKDFVKNIHIHQQSVDDEDSYKIMKSNDNSVNDE